MTQNAPDNVTKQAAVSEMGKPVPYGTRVFLYVTRGIVGAIHESPVLDDLP